MGFIGMNLVGQVECSHVLVDKCVQTAEDNVLRRVQREDCTPRQQDLESVMKVKEWRPDAFRPPQLEGPLGQPHGGPRQRLYPLKYARQRRA